MSEACCSVEKLTANQNQAALKKVFWAVLIINFVMFVIELTAGLLSSSNALIADSLDMLGDALVYGLSLFVIAKTNHAKATASLVKGIVMTVLALLALMAVLYKVLNPALPEAGTITVIGVMAIIANLACLVLLTRHRNQDINVSSAWVCSRNDVVANSGVIIAGILVWYFASMWPDVIVGLGIALLVLHSSVRVTGDSLKARNLSEKS